MTIAQQDVILITTHLQQLGASVSAVLPVARTGLSGGAPALWPVPRAPTSAGHRVRAGGRWGARPAHELSRNDSGGSNERFGDGRHGVDWL
jgi:hypothetical protein